MSGNIYVLRNKNNGKCYVGQSVNLKSRLRDHAKSYGRCYVDRAIHKHGWGRFEVFSCSEIPDWLLDVFERAMIAQVKSLKPGGYNLDSGGNKLKKQHKDANQKRSRAIMGAKHPLYGTHLTEAQKKHLSKLNKGRVMSKIARRRMSEASKGKPRSEAQKAVQKNAAMMASLKNRGADSHMARAIYCIDTGEIFLSLADACRKYGIPNSNLVRWCRQKSGPKNGHRWAYMEAA